MSIRYHMPANEARHHVPTAIAVGVPFAAYRGMSLGVGLPLETHHHLPAAIVANSLPIGSRLRD